MNSAGRSCALCTTLVQVGRDTETLKEPVTRWHRAAWSHLYCRDTIVAVVPHSADSVASFVVPGIAGSSPAPRQLLVPFCCVHMLPLIKLIKGKTDTFFCPPSLPVLHSLFLLPLLRHRGFQSCKWAHFMCLKTNESKNKQKSPQHACSWEQRNNYS